MENRRTDIETIINNNEKHKGTAATFCILAFEVQGWMNAQLVSVSKPPSYKNAHRPNWKAFETPIGYFQSRPENFPKLWKGSQIEAEEHERDEGNKKIKRMYSVFNKPKNIVLPLFLCLLLKWRTTNAQLKKSIGNFVSKKIYIPPKRK